MSEAVQTKMGRPPIYDFHAMKIGQKYIINVKRPNISAACSQFAKRQTPVWRFRCKAVTDTSTEITRLA